MIKINNCYTEYFKIFSNSYNYNVKPGVWLTFDRHTLEYIGVNVFYTVANFNSLNKECEDKLNELIAKGLLEVID